MSHTPPVDSKGAAIREDIAVLVYTALDDANIDDNKLVEQQIDKILAILAQEVNKARIDEVKKIWGHAREHTITDIEMIMHQTGGKVDFVEAVTTDHLENRLTQLERLG